MIDFELVAAIRDVAKTFADKVITLRNSEKEFDKLFPQADSNASYLGGFTGAVSKLTTLIRRLNF